MADDILRKLSREFSVRIVNVYKFLIDEKKEFVMSKQLLRAGTSIGANIHEAKYAESKKDFIHKLHIALKEASETEYWFATLIDSGYLEEPKTKLLIDACIQLIKLLQASIKTAKKSINEDTMNDE